MKVIILFALISLAAAHGSSGGLTALTEPVVIGVVNPLLSGVGKGVAGASGGTQRSLDLLAPAIEGLLRILGDIAGNVEQGAGTAAANAAPAVQGTVKAIQDNSGLAGDAVRTITGGH